MKGRRHLLELPFNVSFYCTDITEKRAILRLHLPDDDPFKCENISPADKITGK
jgi:hypothetical protein